MIFILQIYSRTTAKPVWTRKCVERQTAENSCIRICYSVYARTHTRNYLNRIFNNRSERHRVKLRFTIYYLSAQRQKETFCIKKCVEIRPSPPPRQLLRCKSTGVGTRFRNWRCSHCGISALYYSRIGVCMNKAPSNSNPRDTLEQREFTLHLFDCTGWVKLNDTNALFIF